MKFSLTAFMLLIIYLSSATAQNPKLDSLHQALKNIAEPAQKYRGTPQASLDTMKVNTLNHLAWESYLSYEYDQMLRFAEEARNLAENSTYPEGKGTALNILGYYHKDQKAFDEASAFHHEALAIGESIQDDIIRGRARSGLSMIYYYQGNYNGCIREAELSLPFRERSGDKKGVALAHRLIGLSHHAQGNYPEAIAEHYKALKISEEINDKSGMAASYTNIGNINNEQGETDEALRLHHQCLELSIEMQDPEGQANAHNNIGVIYSNTNRLDEALKEHQAALKLREELGDQLGIATSLTNLGVIYSNSNKPHDALREFFASLKITEEIDDPIGRITAYLNIGMEYINLNAHKEAKTWLQKGLDLSTEVHDMDGLKVAYAGLSRVDSLAGNFQGALKNYQLFIQYRDSILNNENTRKTVQTQMQYDFDKKEAATKAEQDKKDALTQAQLRRQRIIRNAIGAGFLLVALFSTIVVRQRNKISLARKQSDELLLNILPAEVADELKEKGAADAKHFDQATVLFTDFKNFTELSERMSPAQLVNELNTCFKAFDELMIKYRIEKIKTIGDAYMAVGGLPDPQHGGPLDVVNAALDMQAFMRTHKQEREALGLPYFEMRVGIHTGPLVAGIVGVKKFQYDVWGDTVNMAARMESSGDVQKVNISETTYEIIKETPGLTFTNRGMVQAKGKGEVSMWFVERGE